MMVSGLKDHYGFSEENLTPPVWVPGPSRSCLFTWTPRIDTVVASGMRSDPSLATKTPRAQHGHFSV